MRGALLLLVLAGCPVDGTCEIDVDCDDGSVCARNHECLPASEVREVRVTWTVNGAPASAAACGDRDLYIEFQGATRDDRLQFQPVPCFTGQFSVDKLPRRMGTVELGTVGPGDTASAGFDAAGLATLDLAL